MATRPSDTPSTASKPTPPKDLILLRNSKNGEVYRFSCRTCIDGHRAPLCDPKKHRGKIMYRRPNPGRPARQCGHPKSVQCDCLAKRTLCCVLSAEEWDQVTDGKIVTIAMFDSLEDLEASQGRIRMNVSNPGPGASAARGPSTMSTPQTTRLPMFGVGAPHGGVDPRVDPFAWSGIAPQMAAHQQSPVDGPSPTNGNNMHTFQALPPNGLDHPRQQSQSQTQAQFGQFQVTMPAMHPPSSITSGPYSDYAGTTPRSSVSYSTDPSTPLDARVHALQRQMSSHLDINQMASTLQSPYGGHVAPRTMSIDHPTFTPTEIKPDPMNIPMGMPTMSENSPGPHQQLSQSCCSKRSKPSQPQMQRFESYIYPGLAPLSQFPCPNCASTLCTCANCPSPMQSLEYGGAWAQACGRTGHLENAFPGEYSFPIDNMPPPAVLPQQHTQVSSLGPPQTGCHAGGMPVHQPMETFDALHPAILHEEWPSHEQYPQHFVDPTVSIDPHPLSPSQFPDEPMLWPQ